MLCMYCFNMKTSQITIYSNYEILNPFEKSAVRIKLFLVTQLRKNYAIMQGVLTKKLTLRQQDTTQNIFYRTQKLGFDTEMHEVNFFYEIPANVFDFLNNMQRKKNRKIKLK